MILEVKNLESKYDLSQVLFGINLHVDEGESVCILGRNGVGKSTTLNTIMGIVRPTGGEVIFEGNNIAGLPPYKISRKGIALVPQGRHIYPNLTVKENLILAERNTIDKSSGDQWNFERIYELFPILKTRGKQLGNRLSGGEQQMLAIARGLISNPRLLVMDEICEGLAPIVCQELIEVVKKLRAQGVSILIAEQSVKFAISISDRCYIIEKGSVVYEGASNAIPQEIIVNYLSV